MLQSSYEAYLYPVVILRVDGKSADDIAQYMTSFELDDDIKKLPHAKIKFVDPEAKLINDSRFDLDTIWSVKFGYPSDMSRANDFRLAFYEPEFPASGALSITVTLLHTAVSMQKVASGRHWGKVASSEIAKRLAKRHKLKAKVEASGDAQGTYTQPHTMSDFQYLSQLADRIDFEFFVDQDTLYYRSKDTARREPPRATFVYGGANQVSLLEEFHPTIASHHGKKLHLLGADTNKGTKDPKGEKQDKQKASIGASSKDIDAATGANSTPEDKSVWDLEAGNLLGFERDSAAAASAPTAETNQTKVDKLAKAIHREFLERAVKGEAHFIGSPAIRAKTAFNFVGTDRRLSGAWYMKSTNHKIDAGSSYKVTAHVHRGSYTDGRKKKEVDKKTTDNGAPTSTNASSPLVLLDLPTGTQTVEEPSNVAVPLR